MLGTIRYKNVRNTTGAVFTASNFSDFTDGEDRQIKHVRRVLSEIDIGEDDGKTQSENGVILTVFIPNHNILWVDITVTRPVQGEKVLGGQVYSVISNGIAFPIPNPQNFFNISWCVDSNNCLRLFDQGIAEEVQLKENDVINCIITLGEPSNSFDRINP